MSSKAKAAQDSEPVGEPAEAATPEPAYKYVGPGFHLGVPARDLTDEDVAKLEPGPLADLKASVHYMAPQNDPAVAGRTNSDTIAPGVAVPPATEPVTTATPGFAKSDTVLGGDPDIG